MRTVLSRRRGAARPVPSPTRGHLQATGYNDAGRIQAHVLQRRNIRWDGRDGFQKRFGRANSRIIERDFTNERRRDFTIRRAILWESEAASDSEANVKECEFINSLRSNDPPIGCSQQPKFIGDAKRENEAGDAGPPNVGPLPPPSGKRSQGRITTWKDVVRVEVQSDARARPRTQQAVFPLCRKRSSDATVGPERSFGPSARVTAPRRVRSPREGLPSTARSQAAVRELYDDCRLVRLSPGIRPIS